MAWMGLIVRSRALDLLRRRTAERAQLTQEFDEVMADTLESDAAEPDGQPPTPASRPGRCTSA